jgi:hypothetical protein
VVAGPLDGLRRITPWVTSKRPGLNSSLWSVGWTVRSPARASARPPGRSPAGTRISCVTEP